MMRRRDSVNPSAFPDESFQFVGLENIEQGGLGGLDIQEFTGADILSQKTRFREGDVLYGKLRPNLNKVAVAPRDGVCSTDIWAFQPHPFLSFDFAFFVLGSERFVQRVAQLTRGANLPRVEASSFDTIEVPIPPLSEQHRIVEVLHEAEAIRRLRVEAERKTAELIPALFHEMFGDPVRNERHHRTSPLGKLLSGIDSGWSPQALNQPAAESEWGILKLGAVTWGEYNDEENKALPAGVEPRPELEVSEGDLLFARKNTYELVGASAYVWETRPRLILPDLIFRLRINAGAKLEPLYLWALLSYPAMRRFVQRLAGGAANSMPNIPKGRLNKLVIPVPDEDSQKRFADAVREIRGVSRPLLTSDNTLAELRASLLARAFTGELTAEWRERHAAKLSAEALDRDEALRAAGVRLGQRATIQEIDRILGTPGPDDARYADLNAEQLLIARTLDRIGFGQHKVTLFNLDQLAGWLIDEYGHDELAQALAAAPEMLRAPLDVLAARGLVQRYMRSRGKGGFATLYRLPWLVGEEGKWTWDDVRAEELERLASPSAGVAFEEA